MASEFIKIVPIPTDHAKKFWSGQVDANDQPPEQRISDGGGIDCRHCLSNVISGEPVLLLSYCPFPEAQPFAESGPIFLHANPCKAYTDHANIPPMHIDGKSRIIRGYDSSNQIIYGTGKTVESNNILTYAKELISDPDVAYVHVRSSGNNCYAFRMERTDS